MEAKTGRAGNAVQVHAIVTRQDHSRFVWWTRLHDVRELKTVALGGVLIIFCLIGGILCHDRALLLATLGVAVYFTVLYLLVEYTSRRAYQSNRSRDLRYIFSLDGVEVRRSSESAEHGWDTYRGAVETRSAFYLYLGDGTGQVLPKRCFTSEEQMERFRDIVRAGMGEKARGIRA